MHSQKYTYAQVAIAAESLIKKGCHVTLKQVRDMLGASANDEILLSQHLEEWNNCRGNQSKIDFVSSRDGLAQYSETDLEQQIILRTQELAESLSLVRATLESTEDGIIIISKEGKLVDWNQKFLDIYQLTNEMLNHRDESVGFNKILSMCKNPDQILSQVSKLYENPEAVGDMGEVELVDGRILERYSQPHRVDGEIVGRVWSFRDVTLKRQSEEALKLRQRAIDASTHGVIIVEADTKNFPIIYSNPAFISISNLSEKNIIGNNFLELISNKEQPGYMKLKLAMTESREVDVELRSERNKYEALWIEINLSIVKNKNDVVSHYVFIVNDITHRKKMEEELILRATHDSLTNLPNRSLLADRAERAIQLSQRKEKMMAMLFLDLDEFKLVNDTRGHKFGDELLIQAATRLDRLMNDNETIARVGGDEFIAIIPCIDSEIDAIKRAQELLKAIEVPFSISNETINISTSVGISLYPRDGKTVDELMKCSDMSMYLAKDNGRNNFKFYTKELNDKIERRLLLQDNLRKHIGSDEFKLHFQPIVDIASNKIVGAESLIRWFSKDLGFIPPDEFIGVAEESGLILKLSEWIINTACDEITHWKSLSYDKIFMSINLSAREFSDKDFVRNIKHIIKQKNICTELVELEITERMLVSNTEETLSLMKKIKKMGLSLSLDDFGTGYSSMSYLKRFPLDKLKIDRSFIMHLSKKKSAKKDNAIVKAIITLAHSLDLIVVAEGVETEEQYNILQDLGADYIQGYYFSKPQERIEFDKLLDKHNK